VKVTRRPVALLTALALAVPLAVACGGDDDEGAAGGTKGRPAKLVVGVIPIAPVAPLYLGIDKSFFKAENLEIEPHFEEGGVTVTAAVIAGEFQAGFSNTVSLLTAAEKDLPLRMLTQGVSGEATKDEAWGALLVAKGSGIRTAKDLEGRTVAVNTINNGPHMVVLRSLQKAGADWHRVKFIEVGFAEGNAALEAGRVDAAWMVEPFVTNAQNAGSRVLLTPYIDTAPDLTVSTYFTSQGYIDSNPDVVERFTRAMNRSLEYAQTHPDGVRRIVTTYTEIPKEAAAKMKLPVWHADMNVPTIELTARLSREYGFLEKEPDLGTLIHEAGEGGTS
jgi:NitT/TauT family transport system substrate-binding protein